MAALPDRYLKRSKATDQTKRLFWTKQKERPRGHT